MCIGSYVCLYMVIQHVPIRAISMRGVWSWTRAWKVRGVGCIEDIVQYTLYYLYLRTSFLSFDRTLAMRGCTYVCELYMLARLMSVLYPVLYSTFYVGLSV